MAPFIEKIEVTAPPSRFWEEMKDLEAGLGFGTFQLSFCKVQGFDIHDCHSFMEEFGEANSKKGVDNRLLMLAFALTIPFDMIPSLILRYVPTITPIIEGKDHANS